MIRFYLRIPVDIPDFIYRLAVRITLIYRRFRFGYAFRKIPLTQDKYAIVDVEDYEQLNQFKWCANGKGRMFYAVRNEKRNKKSVTIFMHRKIMNQPADKVIDHINHNGLDNRRSNLRIVTQEQNVWNSRKLTGNYTSKYKGTAKTGQKWEAKIWYKKRRIYLGCFDDELAAARAYDAKAKELFGDCACLNFPEKKQQS